MIVCKECGCENVQSKEWVEVNTGKNCGFVEDGSSDKQNNWCPDCDENVDFVDKE